MIIKIPCDTFTQKVLEFDYLETPINLLHHPELYATFLILEQKSKFKKDIKKETPESAQFKNYLTFDIPITHLYDCVAQIPIRAGLRLKHFARNIFHNYVHVHYACGQQCLISIENFCDERKIELDVEITFEALSRSYKRYFSAEKREVFDRNRRLFVMRAGHKISIQKRQIDPFTDSQLESIINEYIEKNINIFHVGANVKNPQKQNLIKALRAFVWREVGGRPVLVVIKKFKITDRCLRRRVASFRNFLLSSPAIVLPSGREVR